jgi:F-type H+-transporting ATPase subunit b
MGSALAADTAAAAGEHGSIWADPETWVAVAFVLFVVLLGKILWSKIAALLDKRAADISKALAEASRLRDEALKAKTDAEKTLAQATAEAESIVAMARSEVQGMQARAAQNLKSQIALREQQALDRIAQSEAAAAKQVRDTAIDVALGATRALLREQVGQGRTAALIDDAIAELPRNKH